MSPRTIFKTTFRMLLFTLFPWNMMGKEMTIDHVRVFVTCRPSAGTQDIVEVTIVASFGLTKTSEVAHLSLYAGRHSM